MKLQICRAPKEHFKRFFGFRNNDPAKKFGPLGFPLRFRFLDFFLSGVTVFLEGRNS